MSTILPDKANRSSDSTERHVMTIAEAVWRTDTFIRSSMAHNAISASAAAKIVRDVFFKENNSNSPEYRMLTREFLNSFGLDVANVEYADGETSYACLLDTAADAEAKLTQHMHFVARYTYTSCEAKPTESVSEWSYGTLGSDLCTLYSCTLYLVEVQTMNVKIVYVRLFNTPENKEALPTLKGDGHVA